MDRVLRRALWANGYYSTKSDDFCGFPTVFSVQFYKCVGCLDLSTINPLWKRVW